MRLITRLLPATFLALGSWIASAQAYTYETSLSSGCHEALSWETLRALRTQGLALGRSLQEADQALVNDVQFAVPSDMRDLDAVTLVLGNRDNDVKGLSGLDPKDLAEVHGEDAFQAEHCLRRKEHDGEDGDAAALRECRAFIRAQASRAIRGLGDDGKPNSAALSPILVFFDFSGQREVLLPTFYLHAGRALHTLQDSFTHALRNPEDLREVTSVLNWVDEVEEQRLDVRDGAPHLSALDDCVSSDPHVQARYRMARTASEDFMRALLEPGTDAQKLARVDVVLDTYLQHSVGCDASNDWCDAPELAVAEQAASCSSQSTVSRALLWWVALIGLLLFGRRRSRRLRSAWLATFFYLVVVQSPIQAQSATNASETAGKSRLQAEPAGAAFGATARVAGSIDRGGAGVAVGGRLAINDDWWIGLDFEWNPWFSVATLRTRPGTLNIFTALIWRWHQDDSLSLRTTGRLGVSALLFDLVGAPSGSVGPCLGINLLGLDLPLSSRLHFVVDPAEVLVAIPQTHGAPIAYVQYRLALGLVFF